jgi:NhaP-type Na+/H+ or K+/H+ antiporter
MDLKMKFSLRDVRLETKYSCVAIATMALMIFLGSYVSWAIPTLEGFLMGAIISVAGSVFSLLAVKNKLLKHIEGELAETIKISEGVHIVLKDKDGNVVKEIRIPSQKTRKAPKN